MSKQDSLEAIKSYMQENKTIMQYYYEDGASWFASKSYNPFSLADTYVMSADLIINEAKNYDLDDIIASPVIFLYRHATELYIKQILEQLNTEAFKTHNIKKLYNELEKELKKIAKNKNLKISSLLPDKQTFKSILEFDSISPKSDELRYSDSEILDSKNITLFLNFKNAQYHANNINKYFKNLEKKLELLGFPKKYGFKD